MRTGAAAGSALLLSVPSSAKGQVAFQGTFGGPHGQFSIGVGSPAFAAVAVSSLALGIGANIAVFTIINALLLRPLPYPDADRLVRVFEVDPRAGRYPGPVSPINYFAWRDRMSAFEQTTLFRRVSFNVSMATSAVQVEGFRVDAAFFPLLGVVPALGRGFSPDEMKPGRDDVVLLTDGFWRRQFGGSASILGQSLLVDGTRCTVVGVLPASFSIFRVLNRELQVFRPLVVDATDHEQSLNVYARLKPGIPVDAASAELATVYTTLPIRGHQWWFTDDSRPWSGYGRPINLCKNRCLH